ncbi:tyrosine-type recombinase/integrase [Collimonas silvisoli]|uniref:tyrosine-type recombinase/integrase n=1 Tax=Collimonas silvisoli TaxID=2825884 RepID=UPI001B8AAB37
MADLTIVLIDAGMRLSEALRIRDMDIDRQQRTVAIWENKADHPRAVPMTSRVHEVFERRSEPATPFSSSQLTQQITSGLGYVPGWAWIPRRNL